MRVYCIAIIKNRYDKIEAFRFLDIDTLKENIINGTKLNTIDVHYNKTVGTLINSPKAVTNLEYVNREVKGTEGSLSRYPVIKHNKVEKNSIVILKQVGDEYICCNYDGVCVRANEETIVKTALKVGIANGKVVDNRLYAISGTLKNKENTQNISNGWKITRELINNVTVTTYSNNIIKLITHKTTVGDEALVEIISNTVVDRLVIPEQIKAIAAYCKLNFLKGINKLIINHELAIFDEAFKNNKISDNVYKIRGLELNYTKKKIEHIGYLDIDNITSKTPLELYYCTVNSVDLTEVRYKEKVDSPIFYRCNIKEINLSKYVIRLCDFSYKSNIDKLILNGKTHFLDSYRESLSGCVNNIINQNKIVLIGANALNTWYISPEIELDTVVLEGRISNTIKVIRINELNQSTTVTYGRFIFKGDLTHDIFFGRGKCYLSSRDIDINDKGTKFHCYYNTPAYKALLMAGLPEEDIDIIDKDSIPKDVINNKIKKKIMGISSPNKFCDDCIELFKRGLNGEYVNTDTDYRYTDKNYVEISEDIRNKFSTLQSLTGHKCSVAQFENLVKFLKTELYSNNTLVSPNNIDRVISNTIIDTANTKSSNIVFRCGHSSIYINVEAQIIGIKKRSKFVIVMTDNKVNDIFCVDDIDIDLQMTQREDCDIDALLEQLSDKDEINEQKASLFINGEALNRSLPEFFNTINFFCNTISSDNIAIISGNNKKIIAKQLRDKGTSKNNIADITGIIVDSSLDNKYIYNKSYDNMVNFVANIKKIDNNDSIPYAKPSKLFVASIKHKEKLKEFGDSATYNTIAKLTVSELQDLLETEFFEEKDERWFKDKQKSNSAKLKRLTANQFDRIELKDGGTYDVYRPYTGNGLRSSNNLIQKVSEIGVLTYTSTNEKRYFISEKTISNITTYAIKMAKGIGESLELCIQSPFIKSIMSNNLLELDSNIIILEELQSYWTGIRPARDKSKRLGETIYKEIKTVISQPYLCLDSKSGLSYFCIYSYIGKQQTHNLLISEKNQGATERYWLTPLFRFESIEKAYEFFRLSMNDYLLKFIRMAESIGYLAQFGNEFITYEEVMQIINSYKHTKRENFFLSLNMLQMKKPIITKNDVNTQANEDSSISKYVYYIGSYDNNTKEIQCQLDNNIKTEELMGYTQYLIDVAISKRYVKPIAIIDSRLKATRQFIVPNESIPIVEYKMDNSEIYQYTLPSGKMIQCDFPLDILFKD